MLRLPANLHQSAASTGISALQGPQSDALAARARPRTTSRCSRARKCHLMLNNSQLLLSSKMPKTHFFSLKSKALPSTLRCAATASVAFHFFPGGRAARSKGGSAVETPELHPATSHKDCHDVTADCGVTRSRTWLDHLIPLIRFMPRLLVFCLWQRGRSSSKNHELRRIDQIVLKG